MFKSFKTNAQLMPAKYVHVGTLINMISNSLMVFFFTKNSVEKLRERRDKLRERLKHGPHEILQEYLKMGQSSRRKYTDTSKQAVLTAARLLHKRKLVDLCDAYRLTGISVVSQETKQTCFRCETFFNSRYHEPYYVEVELKDNTLKVSQLLQHYMHNIYRQVLEDTLVDVPQRRNNV